jgi:hypothetical protein
MSETYIYMVYEMKIMTALVYIRGAMCVRPHDAKRGARCARARAYWVAQYIYIKICSVRTWRRTRLRILRLRRAAHMHMCVHVMARGTIGTHVYYVYYVHGT